MTGRRAEREVERWESAVEAGEWNLRWWSVDANQVTNSIKYYKKWEFQVMKLFNDRHNHKHKQKGIKNPLCVVLRCYKRLAHRALIYSNSKLWKNLKVQVDLRRSIIRFQSHEQTDTRRTSFLFVWCCINSIIIYSPATLQIIHELNLDFLWSSYQMN